MPLYDYRCHRCGETFEVRQSFADAILTVHEGCGGEVERLISLPALQFKGTGWYVTDYGRNGKSSLTSTSAKADAKSESKSGASTETKTESKPEAKTEAKADSKPSSAPPAAKP